MAFKLDKLPDTNGETVKLKLKWKSFSGEKSVELIIKHVPKHLLQEPFQMLEMVPLK